MMIDSICVISTDEELNGKICNALNECNDRPVIKLNELNEIEEYLRYEMPENILLNFHDSKIDISNLIAMIIDDVWLHQFSIIGFYDDTLCSENELIEKYIKCNLIHLIPFSQVNTQLTHILRLLEKNTQILFQKGIFDCFTESLNGSITLDNDPLSIPCCVNLIVNFLYQKGYIDGDIKFSLTFALKEMVINAIEHGNCEITSKQKQKFLSNGRSILELVKEKTSDPLISKRKVHFDYQIKNDESIFRIEDEGQGFDHKTLACPMEEENAFLPSGRGIYMTRFMVDELSYNEKGNIVTIKIKHKTENNLTLPRAFTDEKVLVFNPDDTVFLEGESGDYIYYISSGTYGVYHDNHLVSTITPADIFMGEMSFLLNSKRSATVKAVTTGKLVQIPKNNFINTIRKYPYYGMFLSKILAKKLLRTNHVVSKLG